MTKLRKLAIEDEGEVLPTQTDPAAAVDADGNPITTDTNVDPNAVASVDPVVVDTGEAPIAEELVEDPVTPEENEAIDETVETEEAGTDLQEQSEEIADDTEDLIQARQTEQVLQAKVDKGEDLTDEEIYVATESIGRIFSKNPSFEGFGFEAYEGKKLTQKQKSKIALEAITNQNGEKAKTIKAKIENFINGLNTYNATAFNQLNRVQRDAEKALEEIKNSNFTKKVIRDRRVGMALQRGKGVQPFNNYKDVLKAINNLIGSYRVCIDASKYETTEGGKGGKYDLEKLASDMGNKVIARSNTSVTYDLNPDMLNGFTLTVKLPSESGNYVMRNLKSNFVISSSSGFNLLGFVKRDNGANNIQSLDKQTAIALLKEVISYTKSIKNEINNYTKKTSMSAGEVLKLIGKSIFGGTVTNLVRVTTGNLGAELILVNSLVYRIRVNQIANTLSHITTTVLRGLVAWAVDSAD